MKRKKMRVNLPGISRPAIIVIAKAGQISPDRGDDLQVRWQLMLPASRREKAPIEPLRFGYRLGPVAGENLTADWGEGWARRQRYVWRSGYTYAWTWADAFEKAGDYLSGEIEKLVEALKTRQKVLEDADVVVD